MTRSSISHQSQSPTVRLLRTIGSPLMPLGEKMSNDSDDFLELYQLAVRNKIPLLYLEALNREGKLNQLAAEYVEEKTKYLRFIDGIARVSAWVVFPEPSIPVKQNRYTKSLSLAG